MLVDGPQQGAVRSSWHVCRFLLICRYLQCLSFNGSHFDLGTNISGALLEYVGALILPHQEAAEAEEAQGFWP